MPPFVSYVPFTDNPILCTKLPSQEVFAFLSFADNAVDVVKQTNYYPQEVIEIWNIPEGGSMGMWKVFLRQYFETIIYLDALKLAFVIMPTHALYNGSDQQISRLALGSPFI